MKVDKAPQPSYFKHGWVEFHQPRNEQLHYLIIRWDFASYSIIEQGFVKDEEHLKDLQSFGSVKHE